jgi:uncharacterized lipoprotein YmbA
MTHGPQVALAVAVLLLAGCGSAPPPDRLLRLPLAAVAATSASASPTVAAAPPAAAAAAAASPAPEPWQLVLPVAVPSYLDTSALLVPDPGAGLAPLPGVRWAEPLRDAVPRLLRHDLAQLRGDAGPWTAPLPPGLVAARLRVELLAFEAEPDGGAVRLAARWSIARADGSALQAARAELRVPVTGAGPDALVLAHRQALRQLAERIARAR